MFHVWITVALPINEGYIVSGLVSKGYDVSAAAETNQLLLKGNNTICGVISCRVERETANVKELYEDVEQMLSKNHIQYYSIVISEHSHNCLWNAGNIIHNVTNTVPDIKDKKIVN